MCFLSFSGNADDYLPAKSTLIQSTNHYLLNRTFTGQVEAARSSQLAFEQSGKVNLIYVTEGDQVAKGQSLAQLDIALLTDQLSRARAEKKVITAQLDLAEKTLSRRSRLKSTGHIAVEAFDEAKSNKDALVARLASTDAQIQQLLTQIKKAELKAPYAGLISHRFVDEGTIVAPSTPIIGIVESNRWQFRVGIPRRFLAALQADIPDFITFADQPIPIRLISVNPAIEPQTRTIEVLFALTETKQQPLYSGALATMIISQQVDVKGFWVPSSAITEGIRGLWTIYLLEDSGELTDDDKPIYKIKLANVLVLHQAGEQFYISGLADKTYRIIASGLHKYVPEQLVVLPDEKSLSQ